MVKNPSASARDTGTTGLIPVSERCPGGGNGNPLQYSCLGNSMDRGTWSQRVGHNRATEHIHTKYIRLIPGQRDFELHGFTILHRMQHLNSWFQHVGSSPLTRGRTWTPCHWGSPGKSPYYCFKIRCLYQIKSNKVDSSVTFNLFFAKFLIFLQNFKNPETKEVSEEFLKMSMYT